MKDHVTGAQLERFAKRELGEDEIRALEEHLAACDACAQLARDRAAAARAALRRYFVDEAAQPARTPMRWFFAAAAVLAIVLIASLLMRRDSDPIETTPPIVQQQPPREKPRTPEPVQAAAAYADPEWDALVRSATETGRLQIPDDLSELRGEADVFRGSTAAVEHVDPAGKVINDVRPVFSWPSRAGATYKVYIFDGEREIVRSGILQTTRWSAPLDLPRGRTLTWQVEATRGDAIETIPRPPAPPAQFRIVSESDHRAITRAQSLHPDDALLLGVLHARAGLIDDARTLLERASKTNPAARRLLDSLPKG